MKHLMEEIISELKKSSAEGDLIFSKSKSLKISSQKGAVSEYKVSGSEILGIRTIKEGRVGISYTESMDKESVRLMIKEALANGEMTEANSDEEIYATKDELIDEAFYEEKEVDINTKVQDALRLEGDVFKKDKRTIAVPHNSYMEGEYETLYLNSKGRFTKYTDKVYSISTGALLGEGDKKSIFYHYDSAHRYQDLKWEEVIDTALFHSQNLLNEKALKTGKYNVVFDVDCLSSLLGCFSNFYSAKSALDKVNPFADKIGKEIFSTNLTITDEPNYKDAFRSLHFDSEGVKRKSLTLVNDGILESFFHNSVTAKKFGVVTTGHANRGPASSLNVCGTHMVVRGKKVEKGSSSYIEIIQMDGLHSGANRVTGDFSVAIKGYVWEGGERKQAFANCTLSGNVIELLKHVVVVGDKIESSTDQSFFSMPLEFQNMSVAGI